MLLKKTIGIIIIVFNCCGLGFVFFCILKNLSEKLSNKQAIDLSTKANLKKKSSKIVNDDIIPDEDDLLKDIDLSELDDLDLDDLD